MKNARMEIQIFVDEKQLIKFAWPYYCVCYLTTTLHIKDLAKWQVPSSPLRGAGNFNNGIPQ